LEFQHIPFDWKIKPQQKSVSQLFHSELFTVSINLYTCLALQQILSHLQLQQGIQCSSGIMLMLAENTLACFGLQVYEYFGWFEERREKYLQRKLEIMKSNLKGSVKRKLRWV
jgi:hypothetical protein